MNLRVLVGVCGFPEKLESLNEKVDAVEVQKTFYKPPRVETARRWRERARDVVFTVKAWQVITHPASSPTYRKAGIKFDPGEVGFFKPTKTVFEAFETTAEVAEALGARIIVFQTPASFKQNEENIKNIFSFFRNVERRKFLFGWEPRGNWMPEAVKKICEALDLIHVVDPFKNQQLHGDFSYFRLHGIGGYRYRYSERELKALARLVEEGGKDAYVMFNNTNMLEDAIRFKNILLK